MTMASHGECLRRRAELRQASAHARSMDRKYRHAALVYDPTRRVFLAGRDEALRPLARPGFVLDIGCGTGRNALRIAALEPGAVVHAIDVSSAMLSAARASVARAGAGNRIVLVEGAGETFDPAATFGRADYDGILLSYSLSMMTDWRTALRRAVGMLAPGGRLSVVEFGGFAPLPSTLARLARDCLARHKAPPCLDLAEVAGSLASDGGFRVSARDGPLGFNQFVLVERLPDGDA
jgi:S-adenosylmethionine-diacylgycerolhomoserine-N-methlytransferase